MHNSVNLDGSPADNVEYEVRFDNQDAVTVALQCFVLRYVAYMVMCHKVTDALIQFLYKGGGIGRTIIRDPFEYRIEIVD